MGRATSSSTPSIICFLVSLLLLCSRAEVRAKQICSKHMEFGLYASPHALSPGDRFNLTIKIPQTKSICGSRRLRNKNFKCSLEIQAPDGIAYHRKYGGGKYDEFTYSLENQTFTSQLKWQLSTSNKKRHTPDYDYYFLEFSADVCAPLSILDFGVSLIATKTYNKRKTITKTCTRSVTAKVRLFCHMVIGR